MAVGSWCVVKGSRHYGKLGSACPTAPGYDLVTGDFPLCSLRSFLPGQTLTMAGSLQTLITNPVFEQLNNCTCARLLLSNLCAFLKKNYFISFYPQLLGEAQRACKWHLFCLQHKTIIPTLGNRENLGLLATVLNFTFVFAFYQFLSFKDVANSIKK